MQSPGQKWSPSAVQVERSHQPQHREVRISELGLLRTPNLLHHQRTQDRCLVKMTQFEIAKECLCLVRRLTNAQGCFAKCNQGLQPLSICNFQLVERSFAKFSRGLLGAGHLTEVASKRMRNCLYGLGSPILELALLLQPFPKYSHT
jgi:hypothetical protein